MTRRAALETMGTLAVGLAARPGLGDVTLSAQALPLAAVAGPDRIVMRHGKTYLNGWAGYGAPPRRVRGGRGTPAAPPPDPGPVPSVAWRKVSGPGAVTFADARSAVTTATFSAPGEYVLEVTADNGASKAANPLDANAPRTPWHNCPCCVGNIARTLLMLPTWTYAKSADGLYVNLFVGSAATIDGVAGTRVEIVQATEYPWTGKVSITVNPAAPRSFAVRIRVPTRDVSRLYRSEPSANGIASIAVNGSRIQPSIAQGYAAIVRTWRAGDRIDLELPMAIQRVRADDRIAANRGRVALRYGPLVYNIEQVDQPIEGILEPSVPLRTEWRPDLLGGVMVIAGTLADGTPMRAIPNYARYNRNPPAGPTGSDAARPGPRPPTSIVWIRERPAGT